MSQGSATQTSPTALSDFTLALIKPDAVKAGHVSGIITELNENGEKKGSGERVMDGE